MDWLRDRGKELEANRGVDANVAALKKERTDLRAQLNPLQDELRGLRAAVQTLTVCLSTSGERANYLQPSEVVTRKLSVPKTQLGNLIGKGGNRIRQLEEEHRVRIDIDKSSDAAEDCMVMVRGTESGVEAAQKVITIVADTVERQIDLSQRVGLLKMLLNNKGEQLNEIRKSSGAVLNLVESGGSSTSSPSSSTASAPSLSSSSAAVAAAAAAAASRERNGVTKTYKNRERNSWVLGLRGNKEAVKQAVAMIREFDETSKSMQAPTEVLSVIIGKKGTNIDRLQEETGAFIFIDSKFYAATEDGQIIYADWKPARKKEKADDDDAIHEKSTATGGGGAMQHILWAATDHYRPCVSIERSTFFRDVLLSTGHHSFNLWKEGIQVPLFSSPMATSTLMCATWSPTRPAVLVIGKSDGSLDFWDFADQSHKAAFTVPVASGAITSMQFRLGNAAQQNLAVGDAAGNLHILEIPKNMRKQLNNEQSIMSNFLAHEEKKVLYVQARADLHASNASAKDGDDETNVMDDEDKVAEEEQEARRKKELDDAEAEYLAFEKKMRVELQLDEEVDPEDVKVKM